MKYYIMYEDGNDNGVTVVENETAEQVTTFIEEKINKYDYDFEDFKIVRGTQLSLRTVHTPIKVLLTN